MMSSKFTENIKIYSMENRYPSTHFSYDFHSSARYECKAELEVNNMIYLGEIYLR